MRVLFVMDPIESINIDKDTTFALMLEYQRRGHEVFYALMDGLMGEAGRCRVHCAPLTVQRAAGAFFTRGAFEHLYLEDFSIVWMRKDPPFDMQYITATYLLELADPAKTLVVNRPSGLRDANEKVFILRFPEHTSRTAVLRSSREISEAVDAFGGDCVIKPLDRMGGSGIFRLRSNDGNFNSIVDAVTNEGREFVMIQEYIAAASEGDKRIILMDGEALGAILRVPKGRDFRGNMAVGGQAVASEVTDRDREIVAGVAPALRERGLYFVGLDVIGGKLTEVNVTSPTGVQEINKLCGRSIDRDIVAWTEGAAPV